MTVRRNHDWSDDEVRSWHARYFLGEASINTIATAENPPISAAMIYYHFARLGLKLRNGYVPKANVAPNGTRLIPFAGANERGFSGPKEATDGRDVRAETERPGPVPKRPFAGPPIYRSEFIRGDAERKMRAGR